MQNQSAVIVENVSKKFRLFNSPKERLFEAFHPLKKKYHKEFWALKNLNFEIKKGSTVGIIGRNGAGKSTLLQILCLILKPTSGTITTNGIISPLLALGAGFNPEFTGRQNVLMNGALLGFSQEEMKKRLPEIEAFADIGEFIDQPMKIYSSGMSLRLTFAAAINVDPDILIVDEALAVGDAKFQHKCFGKFMEFQKAGKTIILVTHDTSTIVKHCDTAILLERGEIIEAGEPKIITNYYIDLLFTGKISNYQLSAVLVEEGFLGFNIVHYKAKYYAVLQSLGSIDFARLDDNYLKMLIAEKKCMIGISFEEARQFVNQINPQDKVFLKKNVEAVSTQSKTTELDKFIEGAPLTDNCIYRKNYNKNEFRFGDKRAEIIDYLVATENNFNLTTINSGAICDIYLKIRFFKSIELPMVGFSIKTIDGIVVYASNTRYTRNTISHIKESEILICKFSIKLDLHCGDYFFDIGVAEKLPEKDEPIDIRYGIIHLVVHSKDYIFDGLADFSCTFKEIFRIKHKESIRV